MTKVSRWELEEKREKELLDQFWTAVTLLENKEEVIDFLKALLMPSESLMLAKRIELVKLHDSGIAISDIRRLLHITKVTAYRWQDRFGFYRTEFKLIIDRLKELKQKRLAAEAKRRATPQSRRRHSLLVSALATAAVQTHKQIKKMRKRRSAGE